MIGAILGDIIGSPYEFHNVKTTDFKLISERSRWTDDTVMTIAVAKGLHHILSLEYYDTQPVHSERFYKVRCCDVRDLAKDFRDLGNRYPNAGYGRGFGCWLQDPTMGSYGSLGNGSAMRASPAGWMARSLEEAKELARLTALPTHNHPDGIAGAEAVAVAVYLARQHNGPTQAVDKLTIDAALTPYGYDLDIPLDKIRPTYGFDATCRGSVPQAIRAFLEGNSYEECVRLAVSIGGDSDTIACITGAIADAYYGMTREQEQLALGMLPRYLRALTEAWCNEYRPLKT